MESTSYSPKRESRRRSLLQAREMMDLDLRADMVVLWVANRTRQHRGSEGLIGMAWALFVAGSPALSQANGRWNRKPPAN